MASAMTGDDQTVINQHAVRPRPDGWRHAVFPAEFGHRWQAVPWRELAADDATAKLVSDHEVRRRVHHGVPSSQVRVVRT
jgi:hypothetical protein